MIHTNKGDYFNRNKTKLSSSPSMPRLSLVFAVIAGAAALLAVQSHEQLVDSAVRKALAEHAGLYNGAHRSCRSLLC